MKLKNGMMLLAGLLFSALAAYAYEYDVRQPSDDLKPTFHAADTTQGVWSLNVPDVLSKAKTAGAYALVLNTASWWCPHCELFEDYVIRSDAWKNYVAERGFYLGMLDFPYRLDVPADQQWKSWRTDLGKGWGFKCWMMYDQYLNEIGLTSDQGLAFIMSQYGIQKQLGEGTSAETISITNPLNGQPFSYKKVGYPTLIVYGPDGKELGRHMFQSWLRKEGLIAAEAQEEAIQIVEKIINGEYTLGDDPTEQAPDLSLAQEYNGWFFDEDSREIAGTLTVNTSKYDGRNHIVKARVSLTVNGTKISFPSVNAKVDGCAACGDDLYIEDFSVQRLGVTVNVKLNNSGLGGSVVIGETSFKISGGRNVFRSRDEKDQALASVLPEGVWGLSVQSTATEAPDPMTQGIGSLSLRFLKKGSVSISGRMADGTKVTYKAQAVIGANGMLAVPVDIPLYGKKGGLGFVAWFKDGLLVDITATTPWISAGKRNFVCPVAIGYALPPNEETPEGDLEMTISPIDDWTTIGGLPLADDVSCDEVTVTGKKWKGTEVTGFTAKRTDSTDLLTGTVVFPVEKPNGKIKKVKANFYGIVKGLAAYGTIVVKNEGSFAVKICLCSSCSD